VIAKDDDGIEVGLAQELAELFDGALHAGVLLSEAVDLQEIVEVLGDVWRHLRGLAQVGPFFRVGADLRCMRVADTENNLRHGHGLLRRRWCDWPLRRVSRCVSAFSATRVRRGTPVWHRGSVDRGRARTRGGSVPSEERCPTTFWWWPRSTKTR